MRHRYAVVDRSIYNGFTLIELMIAIAIIAIIAALAIPAYNGYIREARLGAARANTESLRIYLEDWRLDEGTYRDGGTSSFDKNDLEATFNWIPEGDQDAFRYTVTARTTSYDVLVEWEDNTSVWVFCEDRMSNCCDNETSGASKTNCP